MANELYFGFSEVSDSNQSDDGGNEVPFQWNFDTEGHLFIALIENKPVGISKHFHMSCLQKKLEEATGSKISTEQIWQKVDTLYCMRALEDCEPMPFDYNEKESFVLSNEFKEFQIKPDPDKLKIKGKLALKEEKKNIKEDIKITIKEEPLENVTITAEDTKIKKRTSVARSVTVKEEPISGRRKRN